VAPVTPVVFSVMIKDGKELAIAVATIVALVLIVMLPIGLLMEGGGRGPLLAIPMGVVLAAVGGFAFWLSWGGSRVLFRLIVAGLGVLLMCFALSINSRRPSEFLEFATVTLGTSIVVALPRLTGLQRARLGPDGLPHAPAGSRQFSMRDIFIWTATAALMAGFVQWTGWNTVLRHQQELFVWSLRLGICTLVAMWAALAMSSKVVFRLAFGMGMVVLIGWGVSNRLRDFHPTDEQTVATIVVMLVLTGCFSLLRHRGVRLVRSSSLQFTPSVESAPPPSPDNPFDAE
jgi:hypothetical protein